ncbi:DUF6783 domain-containing protein [Blautia sp. HCP3S3_H11]|uniref:DUF6783 domain-containing protein n=2 Tax=unclassified Blautia TaxID=2648079 RepID=UPI003F8EECD6
MLISKLYHLIMEGTFSFHRQTPSGREAPLGFSYTILCNAGFIFQSQKYNICKILYSYPLAIQQNTRACLKKASCKMYVTICGIFCPDEGVVTGYDNRIRAKYTAICFHYTSDIC